MLNMVKLDVYDKRILEVLINNSREQISSISKKIKLRRENVNYRINRLIKSGLIQEFNTILNEKRLGLSHYVVFLELTNLQENTEQILLDYMEKNKYMFWIGPSAGRWSLIFDVIIPEDIELDKVIKGMMKKFSKYIDEYVILKLHEGNYFGFKFLGLIKKPQTYSEHNKLKIDKNDLKILSLLNQNSRTSLVDISEKVGLTPNGVNNRIKNLEKKDVIHNYTISIDWRKLDYEWYGLQLKLTKFGEDIDRELKEYLTNHKKIIFYNKYLGGSWDYDLGIIVKNSNELREFIHEFRKKFSDKVRVSDVFIVLEETSGYKFPEGVFS